MQIFPVSSQARTYLLLTPQPSRVSLKLSFLSFRYTAQVVKFSPPGVPCAAGSSTDGLDYWLRNRAGDISVAGEGSLMLHSCLYTPQAAEVTSASGDSQCWLINAPRCAYGEGRLKQNIHHLITRFGLLSCAGRSL